VVGLANGANQAVTSGDDLVDNKHGEHRWRRLGEWPMALKLIVYTVGLAAALAVGLTAMGYIQAARAGVSGDPKRGAVPVACPERFRRDSNPGR
jgi:hypothetical protein